MPQQPPPNAFAPGTKLTVGSHKISIIKYISAGGFAYVYTCNIEPPFQGKSVACLKRVVVPSKWQLTLLRQEVDAMRRLRGNKHIVSYIDSHASRLNEEPAKQQQYEVLLLMEYCENNGLIDFMNTRLVNKLTEKEIVDIMYQVTIGVAMCHHLRPPLIHRDIKIENVLIDSHHVFKLCDFGSSVNYMAPPRNPQELQLMKDDLMQHTTPQYRAPEMIDLTKGFPVDDKSDIWALGIFLYKLCYYTTPFESPNQSSLQELETCILNCHQNLRFSDQPGSIFSTRLKNVIKVCLRADPRRRPNAAQLLGEIAQMRGDNRVPNVIPLSVIEALKSQKKQSPEPLLPHQPQPKATQALPSLPPPPPTKSKTLPPKPIDAFASIDKSKLFTTNSKNDSESTTTSPFSSEPVTTPSRPLSAYFDSDHKAKVYSQGSRSTTNVQDLVKKELAKGYETTDLTQAKSELEFLKQNEMEKSDTGVKAAWNTLRKLSTGGSLSANSTGASDMNFNRRSLKEVLTDSRRSSDEKIKTSQPPSGVRTASDEIIKPAEIASSRSWDEKNAAPKAGSKDKDKDKNKEKENSIQKRMQTLLDQSTSLPIKKTASGYGRFTDKNVVDDINSINNTPHRTQVHHTREHRKLSPPKVPLNLSSTRKTVSSIDVKATSEPPEFAKKNVPAKTKTPPVKPKKPPVKPKKPQFLQKPGSNGSRRLSTSSEFSVPDIDDLEKQFSKRFPSYV
ncbi:uncharacterized protein LODBEIA_P10280 [Lodderomyces beijingensis]|uniref:non-specific serine/threonine protein kinase n=1 Tax=Lodderomyces beijingensis TaxID=1775926 RepID=A0ABP0ZF68_9ASCO